MATRTHDDSFPATNSPRSNKFTNLAERNNIYERGLPHSLKEHIEGKKNKKAGKAMYLRLERECERKAWKKQKKKKKRNSVKAEEQLKCPTWTP